MCPFFVRSKSLIGRSLRGLGVPMKRIVLFILVNLFTLGGLFAGRPIPNYDCLESRVVELEGAEEMIGVYGVLDASSRDLPARIALNHRVDAFIETGEFPEGYFHMLEPIMFEGRLVPPRRMALLYVRGLDVLGDVARWFQSYSLDPRTANMERGALMGTIIFMIRDVLSETGVQLVDGLEPFQRLIDIGGDADDGCFSDEEYRRVNAYFHRYVDFVRDVLIPLRQALESVDGQGHWVRDLIWGSPLAGRVDYAEYLRLMGLGENLAADDRVFMDEAYHQLLRVNENPLRAFVILSIMREQISGMHNTWIALRNTLAISAFPAPVDSALAHTSFYLRTLNAVLSPRVFFNFQIPEDDLRNIRVRAVELHQNLMLHVFSLYRHMEGWFLQGGTDGSAIARTTHAIESLIEQHFRHVVPLDFEEGRNVETSLDDEESAPEEDEDDDDSGMPIVAQRELIFNHELQRPDLAAALTASVDFFGNGCG